MAFGGEFLRTNQNKGSGLGFWEGLEREAFGKCMVDSRVGEVLFSGPGVHGNAGDSRVLSRGG